MSDRIVRNVVIGVVCLWLVWFFHPFLARRMLIPWNGETVGQWGDTFGALNALMSTLAFGAVFYTIRLQQRQIDQTQRDQHVQRFEQTFYELLRLLREARDDVEFRYSREYLSESGPSDSSARDRVEGTEAFKRANSELSHWISRAGQLGDVSSEAMAGLYLKHIHSRYESSFAPYYRLLYTALLRVKEDEVLSELQKNRYGNLLRSQLTSHEVAMCCYNGLSAVSGSFKSLIVEFRLAKYLPVQFGRKRLMLHYPEIAFSGREKLG